MGRELLLLRHGKSAWNTGAPTDFERPLANRGRKASKRMARWCRERSLIPDRILSSPAQRARQTARRFAKFLGFPVASVRFDERIYDADVPTLLEVLRDGAEGSERLLMVGHNPGFEDLVLFLTGGEVDLPPGGNLMPTAALARLAMPEDWSVLVRGDAAAVEIARPRELGSA